jgi:muramoyltetrapeptide carboxypeptidase LdcA involved in peptidoglycan recycling
MGFKIEIPPGFFHQKDIWPEMIKHRAELLNNAFKSIESRPFICARGGFGSIRILDKIDYECYMQKS